MDNLDFGQDGTKEFREGHLVEYAICECGGMFPTARSTIQVPSDMIMGDVFQPCVCDDRKERNRPPATGGPGASGWAYVDSFDEDGSVIHIRIGGGKDVDQEKH